MNWNPIHPTEPGNYWWRLNEERKPVFAQVRRTHAGCRLMTQFIDLPYEIAVEVGQWQEVVPPKP